MFDTNYKDAKRKQKLKKVFSCKNNLLFKLMLFSLSGNLVFSHKSRAQIAKKTLMRIF